MSIVAMSSIDVDFTPKAFDTTKFAQQQFVRQVKKYISLPFTFGRNSTQYALQMPYPLKTGCNQSLILFWQNLSQCPFMLKKYSLIPIFTPKSYAVYNFTHILDKSEVG